MRKRPYAQGLLMVFPFVPSILVMLFVVECIADPNFAFAQSAGDQVWIEPIPVANDEQAFAPRSLIRRRGTVQSLDDKTLVFLTQGESDSARVVAARLVWVEPAFEDAAIVEAITAFRTGDSDKSIPLLLNAVTSGPQVWKAQWLSMHLWQAALQAQKFPATLELVRQLDARPLPPIILGGLPIQWSSERLPGQAAEAARGFLSPAAPADGTAAVQRPAASDLGATQLVAASWLLSEPDNRMAIATLKELALQNDRPLLSQLATALLWRMTPPPEVLANRISWIKKLEAMPLTLTPGPSFLVAERLEAAGNPKEALPLYLSVAIATSRPHLVTRSAKLRSIQLLKQFQLPDEAARLDDNE